MKLDLSETKLDDSLVDFAGANYPSSDLMPPIPERLDPKATWYVATSGQTTAGLSAVTCAEGLARITILCVERSHRRQGIGKALLEHIVEKARRDGCAQVMITGVDIRDPAARGFVEAMGFRMHRDGVRMEWKPRQLPEVSLPSGYEVRTYRDGDEEGWAKCITKSYATTPNKADYTAERVRENWINTPFFMPDGCYFVTNRGAIVGCFMAWRELNHGPQRGRLHWLAVDPDHRRRGIAKFLTVTVIKHLQSKGLTSIFLDTGYNLKVAMNMYRSLGFVEVPRLFDYVRDLVDPRAESASV